MRNFSTLRFLLTSHIVHSCREDLLGSHTDQYRRCLDSYNYWIFSFDSDLSHVMKCAWNVVKLGNNAVSQFILHENCPSKQSLFCLLIHLNYPENFLFCLVENHEKRLNPLFKNFTLNRFSAIVSEKIYSIYFLSILISSAEPLTWLISQIRNKQYCIESIYSKT